MMETGRLATAQRQAINPAAKARQGDGRDGKGSRCGTKVCPTGNRSSENRCRGVLKPKCCHYGCATKGGTGLRTMINARRTVVAACPPKAKREGRAWPSSRHEPENTRRGPLYRAAMPNDPRRNCQRDVGDGERAADRLW